MSSVTIELQDADGAIACNTNFIGGFNPLSHAHQHAQILLRMMDDLCNKSAEAITAEPAHDTKALTDVLTGLRRKAESQAVGSEG